MKSLIALSVLALTGCANNTIWYNPPDQNMDFADLNYFKWDCDHAAEQTAFLKDELKKTTPWQFDDVRRAIIYKNLNEMQSACPPVYPKTKNCVHVTEDSIKGTGQSTVCELAPRSAMERPVVNRWEPIVDH
jgi:hypothetical protein